MELPFGGVGMSGSGAWNKRHSFETFSHWKAVSHGTHGGILDKVLGTIRYFTPTLDEKAVRFVMLLFFKSRLRRPASRSTVVWASRFRPPF